jgi:hypothetical protein
MAKGGLPILPFLSNNPLSKVSNIGISAHNAEAIWIESLGSIPKSQTTFLTSSATNLSKFMAMI